MILYMYMYKQSIYVHVETICDILYVHVQTVLYMYMNKHLWFYIYTKKHLWFFICTCTNNLYMYMYKTSVMSCVDVLDMCFLNLFVSVCVCVFMCVCVCLFFPSPLNTNYIKTYIFCWHCLYAYIYSCVCSRMSACIIILNPIFLSAVPTLSILYVCLFYLFIYLLIYFFACVLFL